MDYFHNITVVNTQYERLLISAVHMADSAMKMSLFQSSLPLWLLAYLRKFLRNTHFLAFCLSIYCLKTLFQVIRNDWQNLFWQCNSVWSLHIISDQKKRFEEDEWWTVGGMWSHDCCTRLWIIKKSGYKPWLGTLLCSGTQHFTLTVPLSLPRCINRLT